VEKNWSKIDSLIIYNFCIERNKSNIKNRGQKKIKEFLIKRDGRICYLCNKKFKRDSQLEIEHRIPVKAGGKIFCLSNINLACVRCHKKKTEIDRKVIKILKNMGFFIKGINSSFSPLEEIRKQYLIFYKIIRDYKEKYKKWNYGTVNIDYLQVLDKSNREVKE